MIKYHFKILMHCVEKGYAKNIDIHYNTNGTQLPPQEIFDLWSYFKRVEVAFSIDDVGEPFEYQRHPAKWRHVNANLVKFKEMKTDNMENTKLLISCRTMGFVLRLRRGIFF